MRNCFSAIHSAPRPCLDFDHIGQNWEDSNTAIIPKKSKDLSSATAVGMLSDYPVRIGARSSEKRTTQKYEWPRKVSKLNTCKYEGQHKVGHGMAPRGYVFGLF